jgi:glycosyltransferase involved in cell wall biosynthesis
MPAYNEEAAIERVIGEHFEVLSALRTLLSGWEIVCLDDASTDHTWEVLQRLQSAFPGLRLVRHPQNEGIHVSFRRLYEEAQGTHVYSTGSDGQWPAENLQHMLERLLAGADLVVGVRTNRREVYGVPRLALSLGFNLACQWLFRVPTKDAGSVKLGAREVFLLPLVSRSPFSEAERIIKAHRLGYKVGFVPVRFRSRSGGKATGANWKNIFASVWDLLRCVKAYGVRR